MLIEMSLPLVLLVIGPFSHLHNWQDIRDFLLIEGFCILILGFVIWKLWRTHNWPSLKLVMFGALWGLVAVTSAVLLAKYKGEGYDNWGGAFPFILLIGLELKTGKLVIGRSWNTVIATKENHPRFYWSVIGIETAVFILAARALWKSFPLL